MSNNTCWRGEPYAKTRNCIPHFLCIAGFGRLDFHGNFERISEPKMPYQATK